MIVFNKPAVLGTEISFIEKALSNQKLCGDGPFGRACQKWFEDKFTALKTLMVPSCTHALELAALLLDIQPGDEIIMPSFTFVSTANPFVLRGATIVFVDIRPDTMNIDENKIEAAITERTKAIVPVHYAGVSCAMDEIMAIANKYGLFVVEDAAQGVMSTYKERALGTIGHLGAFSFHETKNYTSGGEGGLLLINDINFIHRAEVIREKGTNRSQFYRGMIDKYTWVDIGSSYLPSELQAAYLMAQLEQAEHINKTRLAIWARYHDAFLSLEAKGLLKRPFVPVECSHNAHMYYVCLDSVEQRSSFIDFMKAQGVQTVFHYVPLHTASSGLVFGRFHAEDVFTSTESNKLVRIPLWYGMSEEQVLSVIVAVQEFFV